MTGLLSLHLLIPFAGVLILLALPKNDNTLLKVTAMLFSVATLIASIVMFFRFEIGPSGMQFVEQTAWIPSWGISYKVGIDGISLFLIMITTLLTPIALLSSWNSITQSLKGFLISMLTLEIGIIGVFVSLDLFLFYVFWEVMLIPMYFLIGIWGGENRIYAAVKFIIYTMFGSLLMLVGIFVLYHISGDQLGKPTTDLLMLYQLDIPYNLQFWLFLAFALSFAIKVPLFPFHTWLPDAHVEAPTAASVILAGVLLKMGGYGLLRFCLPLFPDATIDMIPYILTLAVFGGIIYGALVAMVQPDMKKLVAYSSVSHMGFVVLGIFVLNQQGVQGAILHMINHGLSTGALFILVGFIYERRHSRLISDYGGIAKVMPFYAAAFLIVVLSSLGLPGLNGFVGEFLILVGAFKYSIFFAVFAATGVILAAVYLLWMYQRVMFGKVTSEKNATLSDLSSREKWVIVPMIVLIVILGVYPKPVLERIEPSVTRLLSIVQENSNGNNWDISPDVTPVSPERN
ncbi:MAG: NADH-quinone oxidoreductase subunit M [Candidatus Marinimicrobia bacterium]|nr:NADH-quinone oxidoreductase subunit M [Candidatus Neomarinimicrobiota bacterium]